MVVSEAKDFGIRTKSRIETMANLDSNVPDAFNSREEIEGEDYYFDGPYLVFTEAYHRRRGYCCHSGCRHCPYGFSKSVSGAAESIEPDSE